MKILSVYNAYINRGGEDEVFEAEADLLENHGHDVHRLRVEPDELIHPSLVTKARLAARTIWSRSSYQRFRDITRSTKPDLVHFHNTFPLISPSAYAACRHEGVPVVQTLHNFRLLCPNAVMFRNGHRCEDCVGKLFPSPSVVHACYHDSRAETAVIATMLATHRIAGTWTRDIDRYIVLSEFARQKFVEGGLPLSKLRVKPNFVTNVPDLPDTLRSRSSMAYVGRLAPQKGISTMLSAWERLPAPPPLHVIGDGPDEPRVHVSARNGSGARPLGRLARVDVLEEIQKARALIFPSEWYEGFPLTIGEAFACGTPVIASRLGTMAEVVENGRTGLLFTPGDVDDLAAKVEWAWEHPEEMRRMGETARRVYEQKYTPERNYDMLIDIYQQLLADYAGPAHTSSIELIGDAAF